MTTWETLQRQSLPRSKHVALAPNGLSYKQQSPQYGGFSYWEHESVTYWESGMLDIFDDARTSMEIWWNDEVLFWESAPLHHRLMDNMGELRLSWI